LPPLLGGGGSVFQTGGSGACDGITGGIPEFSGGIGGGFMSSGSV
jgi:hypothetical protein